MADRIKGLTLQINGDTTKLSSALKGVNGELRDTQNALKDVDKLLQMDPKNVELLQQKQDLLNKAISDTNDKLKTLKEAQAQMKAQGVDDSSKAYQNLEREIIATEQSVGKLEKSAKECNAEMQKTTSAADKMANAAGKVSVVPSDLVGIGGPFFQSSILSPALFGNLLQLVVQQNVLTDEAGQRAMAVRKPPPII